MAKTTRKTETTGTASTARPARRKPAAVTAHADTPDVKAVTSPRLRTAPAAKAPRATTRKASTIAAEPAVAADRPAAVAAPPVSEPTHGEIAERAYHIYLRRNGWPGNPDHDWLQAIEELRAERRSR